jgi:hypothetical protein
MPGGSMICTVMSMNGVVIGLAVIPMVL